jgi:hypothetical protein
MTAKELFDYLIADAGLDEATAAAITKAAANEKVATKAQTLKQQSEFDAIAARQTALQAELDGTATIPGTKAYRDWYNKNFPEIQKLQTAVARYQERYGALDENGAPPPKPEDKVSPDAVGAMVAKYWQTNLAPQVSTLFTSALTIADRHRRNNRKSELDMAKIAELASAKGGDLVAAYDEWDKPEADRVAKEATDKEVDRRVKEELAKRQTNSFFPAGADASPSSSISPLSKEAGERKYDRNAVVRAAVTGEYGGTKGVQ